MVVMKLGGNTYKISENLGKTDLIAISSAQSPAATSACSNISRLPCPQQLTSIGGRPSWIGMRFPYHFVVVRSSYVK